MYSQDELSARRDARRYADRHQRRVVEFSSAAVAGAALAIVAAALVIGGLAGGGDKALADRSPQATGPDLSAVRVTIAAVGDNAFNKDASLPADGSVYFKRLPNALSGDVVLGNLEGVLANGGTKKCGDHEPNCFSFRAPPSYANAFKAGGFTVLNLANNHALDYGTTGRAETLAAVRRVGIHPTGAGTGPTYFRAQGIRIAVLGFAPRIAGWDLLDIPAAAERVRDAVSRADLVVVTMHAGAEGPDAAHVHRGHEFFLGEDRGDVIAFAHAMVDAGADLVAGHGPHVLRGMEFRRGRLIAYSLGNFAGHASLNWRGVRSLTGVLRVTLRGDGRWVSGTVVPVRISSRGVPARDPDTAAWTRLRALSRADFPGTAAGGAGGGGEVRHGGAGHGRGEDLPAATRVALVP
jgi:poly-gamma-glutamate capsule biosynthesis protein CapA/YwtB (metallophosphatase superfamily)